VYARGGPPGEHDVDFVVHVDDVTKALAAASEPGCAPSGRRKAGWSRCATTTASST
jgi:hypothetical protein